MSKSGYSVGNISSVLPDFTQISSGKGPVHNFEMKSTSSCYYAPTQISITDQGNGSFLQQIGGVNLQHPTVNSPVDGKVTFAGGNYGAVKIRTSDSYKHEILNSSSGQTIGSWYYGWSGTEESNTICTACTLSTEGF